MTPGTRVKYDEPALEGRGTLVAVEDGPNGADCQVIWDRWWYLGPCPNLLSNLKALASQHLRGRVARRGYYVSMKTL